MKRRRSKYRISGELVSNAVRGDMLTQSLGALKPNGRLISVLNDGKALD